MRYYLHSANHYERIVRPIPTRTIIDDIVLVNVLDAVIRVAVLTQHPHYRYPQRRSFGDVVVEETIVVVGMVSERIDAIHDKTIIYVIIENVLDIVIIVRNTAVIDPQPARRRSYLVGEPIIFKGF